ncbi:hypothetical protein [Nocardia cyriacigeorgica]|uniref:hypothetical protein n=1 Tax=Nocardia cyriacigeorgica TaxID=135487 RepID=UPI001893EFB2|nr:hypothetical protein [Nocardia cyriacigeorgica]MBF6455262.1 hypothetical protein [Nocardia cyriacigeorgica]MBF6553996.1 hypothetical protein [Nocardia cyriacigeorgica]
MSTRLPRHITGERVLAALIEARPERLTTEQLAAVTGLTLSQARTGLTWIKDTGALERSQPLTWRRTGGHGMTDNIDDWIAQERSTVHTLYTRTKRLITGTAAPHADRRPDDDWIRLFLDQINGVRAMLESASRL